MCNIREPYTQDAYDKHLESKGHKNMQLFLDYDIWPGKGTHYIMPPTSRAVANARKIKSDLEKSVAYKRQMGGQNTNMQQLLEKAKQGIQQAIESEEKQREEGVLELDLNTARSLLKPYCFISKGSGRICCLACEVVCEDSIQLLLHQMEQGHSVRLQTLKLSEKVPVLYYCPTCEVFIGHSKVPFDNHLKTDTHAKTTKNKHVLNRFLQNPEAFSNPWWPGDSNLHLQTVQNSPNAVGPPPTVPTTNTNTPPEINTSIQQLQKCIPKPPDLPTPKPKIDAVPNAAQLPLPDLTVPPPTVNQSPVQQTLTSSPRKRPAALRLAPESEDISIPIDTEMVLPDEPKSNGQTEQDPRDQLSGYLQTPDGAKALATLMAPDPSKGSTGLPSLSNALLEALAEQADGAQAVLIRRLLEERQKHQQNQQSFSSALTQLASGLSESEHKQNFHQVLAEFQDDSLDNPKMVWLWDGIPPEKKQRVLTDSSLFFQSFEDKKMLVLPRPRPGPTAISRYIGNLAMVTGMEGAVGMLIEAVPNASEKELIALCRELAPAAKSLAEQESSSQMVRCVLLHHYTPHGAKRELINGLIEALTAETITDYLVNKSACLILDTAFRILDRDDPLKRALAQCLCQSVHHAPTIEMDKKERHPQNLVKHVTGFALRLADFQADFASLCKSDAVAETFAHPLGQVFLSEVMASGTMELRGKLANAVLTSSPLSFEGMSSTDHHFVERCIDQLRGPNVDQLIDRCLLNGGQFLMGLMNDKTANFVARKIFLTASDNGKSRISSVLTPKLHMLLAGPYSHHLAVKIRIWNRRKEPGASMMMRNE